MSGSGFAPAAARTTRLVGPAFTLRFVPAREDLATPKSWSAPVSTRTAIEAMPEGCIAVVDAMGVTDAGIFGDILCARMVKRGVAALVTDGVVRDLEGVLGTGLPVWCNGFAAPPSVAGLTFVGWGEPIGCGGVAVFPNDIRGRPGWRRADPAGAARSHPRRGTGAGANGGMDCGPSESRRRAAGSLSDECRNQGSLCGPKKVAAAQATGMEAGTHVKIFDKNRKSHPAGIPGADG